MERTGTLDSLGVYLFVFGRIADLSVQKKWQERKINKQTKKYKASTRVLWLSYSQSLLAYAKLLSKRF